MGLRCDISIDGPVLKAVLAGEFSLAEAKRVSAEAIMAASDRKIPRVLFDARAVTGTLSHLERFQYGSYVADFSAKAALSAGQSPARFAFLATEPLMDPSRFGESVAVSKGMSVRVFDRLDLALAWLEGEPAAHPQH